LTCLRTGRWAGRPTGFARQNRRGLAGGAADRYELARRAWRTIRQFRNSPGGRRRTEIEVSADFANRCAVDRPLPDRKTREQRVVCNDADRPRHPERAIMN